MPIDTVGPMLFGVLLILFEITMGIFLLSSGRLVKVSLIGTMLFVLVLVPIHAMQIIWAAGVIVANIKLLTKSFDMSFLTMIRNRKRRVKERGAYYA